MATLVFHPAIRRSGTGLDPKRRAPVPVAQDSLKRHDGPRRLEPLPPAEMMAGNGRTEAHPSVNNPLGVTSPGAAPVLRETLRLDATGGGPAGPAATAAEQAHLAALTAGCLGGDARCWESLVRSQGRRVYGLCYRFTGSATEAEDLTQDVFLKVYRNLGSFDATKASFGVWLTALTRNLLVDHYRRSRLARASDSLDEPFAGDEGGPTRAERLPDTRPGQERYVAGAELRAKVQGALAHLSPELRAAVILRDLEDMDYREIAEVLGIPQGTVKSRISRGRAELARLLRDMEGQVM